MSADDAEVAMFEAEQALLQHAVDCITLTRSGANGFQVNLRDGEGWRIFYGHDLAETINRALNNGPQREPDEEHMQYRPTLTEAVKLPTETLVGMQFTGRVIRPAPVGNNHLDTKPTPATQEINSRLASALTFLLNYKEDEDCEPTPGGVSLDFDSSKW